MVPFVVPGGSVGKESACTEDRISEGEDRMVEIHEAEGKKESK